MFCMLGHLLDTTKAYCVSNSGAELLLRLTELDHSKDAKDVLQQDGDDDNNHDDGGDDDDDDGVAAGAADDDDDDDDDGDDGDDDEEEDDAEDAAAAADDDDDDAAAAADDDDGDGDGDDYDDDDVQLELIGIQDSAFSHLIPIDDLLPGNWTWNMRHRKIWKSVTCTELMKTELTSMSKTLQ